MKLEDKYPTLEQSKRIAELLGEEAPKCYAVWAFANDYLNGKEIWEIVLFEEESHYDTASNYPAYDLAELGTIFDWELCYSDVNLLQNTNDGWAFHERGDFNLTWYNTEAQARAALLIHLLESQKENK